MKIYFKIIFIFIFFILSSILLRSYIYPYQSSSIFITHINTKSQKEDLYYLNSIIEISQDPLAIREFLKKHHLSTDNITFETITKLIDKDGFILSLHTNLDNDKRHSILKSFFNYLIEIDFSNQKHSFNQRLSQLNRLIKSQKPSSDILIKKDENTSYKKQSLRLYELTLKYDEMKSYHSSLKEELDIPDGIQQKVIWLNPNLPAHFELITLERELTIMLTKYLEANPKVIKTRERIHDLKKSLEPNYKTENFSFKPIEPIKQDLIKDYLEPVPK